jgi:hypothetical protein
LRKRNKNMWFTGDLNCVWYTLYSVISHCLSVGLIPRPIFNVLHILPVILYICLWTYNVSTWTIILKNVEISLYGIQVTLNFPKWPRETLAYNHLSQGTFFFINKINFWWDVLEKWQYAHSRLFFFRKA